MMPIFAKRLCMPSMWRTVVSAAVQSSTVASVADPVLWVVRLYFPIASLGIVVYPPAFSRRKDGAFRRLVNAHSVQRKHYGLQHLLQKERCLVRRRTYVRGQLQGANVHNTMWRYSGCRNVSGTEHRMTFWQPAMHKQILSEITSEWLTTCRARML